MSPTTTHLNLSTYTDYGAKSNPRSFFQKDIKFSDLTSIIEGKDLSEMRKIWQEAAISELRLNLMSALKNKNLGFREIENFSLGLMYNFKSNKLIDQNEKPIKGVVQEGMKVKMIDEKHHHRELNKLKNKERKRLGEKNHPKTSHGT